jgi:periplasmic protein TonB
MESKKHHTKNLEKKRFIFFQIGLAIALAVTLIAFEWKSPYKVKLPDLKIPLENGEWVLPPLILEPVKEMPKPQVTKTFINSNVLEIVEDFTKPKEEGPVDEPFVPHDLLPPEEHTDDTPLVFAGIMPEFPGGEAALFRFLSVNLKYPEKAKRNKKEGKVYLSFVVGKDGKIRDISILHGTPELNEEALRVVKLMPDWLPGIQNGKPVSVKYTFPVKFTLH